MNDFVLRLKFKCSCKTALMIEVQRNPLDSYLLRCPTCGSEHAVPGRPLWFAYRTASEGFWAPTALVEEAHRGEVPSFASGGIDHAHTRDPFLASRPREALAALARTYHELLAKHVQNDTQDGPQNQVNSSLAIEAEAHSA